MLIRIRYGAGFRATAAVHRDVSESSTLVVPVPPLCTEV